MRTILVCRTSPRTWPMVMRFHIRQREAFTIHQDCRELSGALNGGRPVTPPVFAHFDTDRQAVSRPMEVSMLTLLAGWHVLNRNAVVHRKMPDQVADTVAGAGFRRTQRTILQGERMFPSICRIILRAMNGDITRDHRSDYLPTMLISRHHILLQIHLTRDPRSGRGSGVGSNGTSGSGRPQRRIITIHPASGWPQALTLRGNQRKPYENDQSKKQIHSADTTTSREFRKSKIPHTTHFHSWGFQNPQSAPSFPHR